ncbi:MAG TPA: four helix bundle protein [Gemmatimonadaceae bacterium]|nr:four helix bundle protein [Gemmatimonadaceae bacterium]
MLAGVKDLKLWQEAVALAGDVMRAVRQHGRREVPWFLDELSASATAIAVSIADGYGRGDALDQQRMFEQARRSITSFETHLAIARHGAALPSGTLSALAARATSVSRLLAGFLTFIERQKDAEVADGARRISPATSPSPLRKTLDEIYCA